MNSRDQQPKPALEKGSRTLPARVQNAAKRERKAAKRVQNAASEDPERCEKVPESC